MNTKRLMVFGMFGLFVISMMGGVLGADISEEAGEVGEAVVTGIGGFFEPILAPFFGDAELLSRIFFALLLGMIIYSIISTLFTSSSRLIKWGVTGAITALALIGIPSEFIEVIRTQYGAMGATILTVIPFLIILMFSLRSGSILIARLTWIFYSFYYLVLLLYQMALSDTIFSSQNIPYMLAFIVGVIIFFGISSIRDMIFKGKIEGITETVSQKNQERATRLKLEMDRLQTSQA